ncbi:MAG: tRNA (adenosine(37)-N6)-dimethylallyltransferase MiaA [Verrucomicrobiota bacterium]
MKKEMVGSLPLYLTGPTGVGKSGVAMALAKALGDVELINGDAFQLYRGFPLITACPSQEDRESVTHHLYEVLDPEEVCDVGRYRELALGAIADIRQRGKRALIVGGSGLYLKGLTHGLGDVPEQDPVLRAELDGWTLEAICEQLREVDPESLASIEGPNRRYLQRALEIFRQTGTPASQVRTSWKESPVGLVGFLLFRDRAELTKRIDARVKTMWEEGAAEEVLAVPRWSATSEKAIGVREILAWGQGRMSTEECISQIQQASRRYAKRQMTWFRRESWLQKIKVEEGEDMASIVRQLHA